MKYIRRRDDDKRHTHGWDVRIQSIGARRMFSDREYGNSERALQAATNWRNQRLFDAGIPLSARNVVTRSPRNSSGIIGVTVANERGGNYYVVNYPVEPGRSKRKRFPIPDDYAGAQRALKEAVAFRRAQEEKLHGQTIKANWHKAIGKVCQ
ncbi:MAG TPA: hypothetical protein VJ464_15965 [Blastocatellia bacterium]|nr:hypothetical protein [Blastocatellia bacterium]